MGKHPLQPGVAVGGPFLPMIVGVGVEGGGDDPECLDTGQQIGINQGAVLDAVPGIGPDI